MKNDKEVKSLINKEDVRQKNVINLTASENYASQGVREVMGSRLTNKYSEGYPDARYYAGNEIVDKIEILTGKRALKLFGLSDKKWSVNVQPYSGSPANTAVYSALVPIGGKIMGLKLDMGGHLTHGHKVSFSGMAWKQVPYNVNKKTFRLNYNEIARIAKKERPKLIIAGYSAYSRVIDFKKFASISTSVGAYFMVDMAHIAGLIAGRAYPSPFKYADIVTTTTHKTLRGPRGAIIFSKKNIAPQIDKAVFPGLQGGPHNSQTAAIAVSLFEASTPQFRKYAREVVKNARILSRYLTNVGWKIVTGGTDSHLFVIDLSESKIGGKEAEKTLESAGIIVNKNMIPYDKKSPFNPSGIRIGTAAVTTIGMKEREMKIIASLIDDVLNGGNTKQIKKEVSKFMSKFVIP